MARGGCVIRKTVQCIILCRRMAAREMLRRSALGAITVYLTPAVLASQQKIAIVLSLIFCIMYTIIAPVCLTCAPCMVPC